MPFIIYKVFSINAFSDDCEEVLLSTGESSSKEVPTFPSTVSFILRTKTMRRILTVSACFLLLAVGAMGPAPALSHHPSAGVNDATEAADKLRELYFQRTYDRGHRLGQQVTEQFPDALRLQAWTIMLHALDTNLLLDKETAVEETAIVKAESLIEMHADSPWSWFALAGTTRLHDKRESEALEASEKALERAPDHPDVLWLRAKVLNNLDEHKTVIDIVDEHASELDNPAPLLTIKARALSNRARESNSVSREDARATYRRARTADSTHVNAYFYPGWTLLRRQNRAAEAYPLFKTAAQLAPFSFDVHEEYWRAIIGLPDRSNDEKVAEIESDVNALLEQRDDDAPVLYAAAQTYSELGADDKKTALRERILAEAPNSVEAEWTRVYQYRDFEDTHRDSLRSDSTFRVEYRDMLTSFINRPHHHNMELVGGAYRNLFHLAEEDSTVSDERLLEIVNGVVEYEDANPDLVYSDAPITLANRTSFYDRATEIAREGRKKLREEVMQDSFYVDTEQEYQRRLDWAARRSHDALGWVHFQTGRMAKAEKHLQRAHELDQKYEQRRDAQNLYHLGQFYHAKGQLDEAETFYVQGKGEQTMGENPNDEALKGLYEKRHGSLDGYDEYVANLEDRLREERKKKVLAQRIETPDTLSAFTLETLEGDTLSAHRLQDKVAVINVWGKWCGPCVEEMPDIQKLHEKYRSTREVEVLTINNDNNPNEVRAWMKKRGFTFPVLLDDGYLSDNDVRAFPTTWFITEEGRRIAFQKRGYSENLVEEFSWRINALRTGTE